MEILDCLKIVESIELLSKELDLSVLHIFQRIAFMDSKKAAKLADIIKIHDKFISADIVERGKMLGIKISRKE